MKQPSEMTYEEALWECVRLTGADTSCGIPTWPSLSVVAVQEVSRLRKEHDELSDQLHDLVNPKDDTTYYRNGTVRIRKLMGGDYALEEKVGFLFRRWVGHSLIGRPDGVRRIGSYGYAFCIGTKEDCLASLKLLGM